MNDDDVKDDDDLPEVLDPEEEEDPAPESQRLAAVGGTHADDADSSLAELVTEVVEQTPASLKDQLIAFFFKQTVYGPAPDPVLANLTPAIIQKSLEIDELELKYGDRERDRVARDRSQSRIFAVLIFLISVGLIAFLVVYLAPANPVLLERIITLVVGLVGGFMGGYAYGQGRRGPDSGLPRSDNDGLH